MIGGSSTTRKGGYLRGMAACFQWLGSRGQSVLAREPRGQAVGAREDTIAPDLHTLDRRSLAGRTHIIRTYLAPAAVRALGCQHCQPAPRTIAQPRTRAYGFWQQPCLVWLGCIHSFSPNRTRDSVVECVEIGYKGDEARRHVAT